MLNEFERHHDALLAILHTEEGEQKKRYDNAIYIKDILKGNDTSIDARMKILQIHKWLEDLQRIGNEVSRVFAGASTGSVSDTTVAQPVIPAKTPQTPISDTWHSSPAEEPPPADTEGSEGKEPSGGISGTVKAGSESLKGFSFLGKPHNADNWPDLLVKVCELLIFKKPYKFISLGAGSRVNTSRLPILSIAEPQTGSYHKLSNGLFVDTGGSAKEVKARCEYILSVCGYSGNTLKIS